MFNAALVVVRRTPLVKPVAVPTARPRIIDVTPALTRERAVAPVRPRASKARAAAKPKALARPRQQLEVVPAEPAIDMRVLLATAMNGDIIGELARGAFKAILSDKKMILEVVRMLAAEIAKMVGPMLEALIGPMKEQIEAAFSLLQALSGRTPTGVAAEVISSLNHDFVALAQEFETHDVASTTDASRQSTTRSTFQSWTKFHGERAAAIFPDEAAIDPFHEQCKRAHSSDYALARRRVLRRWRTWLAERGIVHAPPAAAAPALPQGPRTPLGEALGIDMSALLDDLFARMNKLLFSGEQSEEFWAVCMRHVGAWMGASSLAEEFNIDEKLAEQWISARKTPRMARARLRWLFMFSEMRAYIHQHSTPTNEVTYSDLADHAEDYDLKMSRGRGR